MIISVSVFVVFILSFGTVLVEPLPERCIDARLPAAAARSKACENVSVEADRR